MVPYFYLSRFDGPMVDKGAMLTIHHGKKKLFHPDTWTNDIP